MKYVTLKTVLPQVAAWFVCSVAWAPVYVCPLERFLNMWTPIEYLKIEWSV
jgi:hypothetical protein